MSRSSSRSGTGRRKHGADRALNTVLLTETATQRVRSKKSRHVQKDTAGMQDVVQEVMVDIDTMLDKQAAQDMPDNGVARRRIEMLREDQWLQRQLAESYDP